MIFFTALITDEAVYFVADEHECADSDAAIRKIEHGKIHEKRLDEINDIAVENTVYHVAQPARNNKHKADVGENAVSSTVLSENELNAAPVFSTYLS